MPLSSVIRIAAAAPPATRVATSPAVTEAVLRVAREAATNAVRHGHATKLRIVLRRERGIELSVEDNGSGFDDGAVHAGFGLTSLRERTELTGGRLRVSAATGGGAVVTAEWPA
jgi:two-component system NarL family sensor kinase